PNSSEKTRRSASSLPVVQRPDPAKTNSSSQKQPSCLLGFGVALGRPLSPFASQDRGKPPSGKCVGNWASAGSQVGRQSVGVRMRGLCVWFVRGGGALRLTANSTGS